MYCLMCTVGKREDERVRLSKKYLSVNPDNIQGKLIYGSEHTY